MTGNPWRDRAGAAARALRYAAHGLARSPTYTVAAVLTLALGIGATTAVFSLLRGIVFRGLPYRDAGSLFEVYERNAQGGIRPLSYPTFEDWRAGVGTAADGMAFAYGMAPLMPGRDGPTPVLTAYVSEGFFRTLGVGPMLGRLFTGTENPSAAGEVVASYGFWLRQLGGDTAAVGRPVVLDDRTFVVVGVAAPEIAYPSWAQLWAPLGALSEAGRRAVLRRDRHADAAVLVRRGSGTALPALRAALERAAERQAAAYPATGAGWNAVQLTSVRSLVLGGASQRLAVLACTAALVFVLACVNVAGLALVRVSARGRELAVRAALGAERGQLLGLLASESVVVSLLGAGAGVVVAAATTAYLRASAPAVLPRLANVRLDAWTLAFAVLLAAVVTVALTLGPGWAPARNGPRGLLGLSRAGTADRPASRARTVLVGLQLGVALALLVGTGLMLRTLASLRDVDPGFDPAGLVTVRVQPPAARYGEPTRLVELYRRLEEAVAGAPNVTAAALSNHLPAGGSWMPTAISVDGRPTADDVDEALFRTISPAYFATMRIPVLAGRPFERRDLEAEPVVVVNRALADRYWPGTDPIGRALTLHRSVQGRSDFGEPIRARVVGVVGNVHHMGQDQPVLPEVYLPYVVNPPTWIQIAIRVRGDPGAAINTLRARLHAVEPLLPLADAFDTLAHGMARGRAPRAFLTRVVTTFAAVALLLAVVGVWGITAHTVARRRYEIGLRVALGAEASRVPLTVVAGMLPVVAAAVPLGLAGGLALGRVMRSQLFGVSAADPVVLGGAGLALAVIALLSIYLPARRAARVDPAVVLRAE